MDYLYISLLGSATFFSGLLIFLFPKISTQYLSYLLAFAGSYLFSTTLVHLIPEVFEEAHHKHLAIGKYILLGFFLQFFLDTLGSCIAHGHTNHLPTHKTHHSTISLLLALCTHAFIEGIVLKKASSAIWIAILLHKLPAAFSLGALLYKSNQPKRNLLISLALFALASPLGFLAYEYTEHYQLLTSNSLLIINATAIGTLFHIATVMLLESNPNHNVSFPKLFAIGLGILIAVLSATHSH